ncbi:hypothetical protein HZA56_14105 [Candidatus Poribacteria bacterium]|nr:hypothetical protein [Candidatus Poribacteria bacterium]
MLRDILIIAAYIVGSFILAAWLGYLMGVYQSSREATFRRRAIKLFNKNGQGEEFLIVTGDSELVAEAYQIVVATSARAAEMSAAANNNEGIALDDRTEEKQDTDRSR